jgi:hypothetical protein
MQFITLMVKNAAALFFLNALYHTQTMTRLKIGLPKCFSVLFD